MKEAEIIEGDTLIDQFMGESITDNSYLIFGPPHYGSDWNKLMPVVEKIGQYGEHRKQIDISIDYFFDGDIKSIWLAVVEFIKWYNNQTK